MNNRRRLCIRSFVVIVALLIIALTPANPWAVKHAAAASDFPAPMDARAATAIVTATHQDERMQHTEMARGLSTRLTSSNLAASQGVYVTQSGHPLNNHSGFLTFWRMHGGVQIFGYPISDEIVEGGRVVQYFERARFELHAEEQNPAYKVQLSLLTSQLTRGRDFPKPTPGSGELFFNETGYGISGTFYDFWRKHDGIKVFGYPISQPLQEVNPTDGQTYTVQYFERARFELHPDELDPYYRDWANTYALRLHSLYEVQLSDVGRQAAEQRGYHFARSQEPVGAPEWSPQLWSRHIDVNLSTQSLVAYEDDTPVYHALVATGKDGFNTPVGTFSIYAKYPRETMVGSVGSESWYVPNIPWVQYVVDGVALHGTYWHDRWGTGTRMSHGCVNLNIDDAQWLYGWADVGTQVNIFY